MYLFSNAREQSGTLWRSRGNNNVEKYTYRNRTEDNVE
jgi:hypothetical protein